MESGNKLLTLAQAAELSACSTKTLRRAMPGSLPPYGWDKARNRIEFMPPI